MLAAAFSAAVLPIVAILALERLGAPVDMSGLDRSLADIYAEFRNPHHVAPFAGGANRFVYGWLPAILQHGAFAALFAVLHRRGRGEGGPPVHLWLAVLNGYVPVAIAIAFADRSAHALAPFYMFRPLSLILLLSCMAAAAYLFSRATELHGAAAVLVTAAAGAAVLPDLTDRAYDSLRDGWDGRIERQRDAAEADLASWIEANAGPDDAVLLEPPGPMGSLAEGTPALASLERTTGRPFLVNFKFVPTSNPDMADWYARLSERAAFFAGDCDAGRRLGARIVVYTSAAARERTAPCTTLLHENARFAVAGLGPAARASR